MRIEIEKQIDAETKEVWSFDMFDLNAVFVAWHKEVKPKGKRKWTIEKFWDKYGRSEYNMVYEPVLPEIIRSEVLSEVMKYIRVHTWEEWKARFTNLQTTESFPKEIAEMITFPGIAGKTKTVKIDGSMQAFDGLVEMLDNAIDQLGLVRTELRKRIK